jgi:hypothetical protein
MSRRKRKGQKKAVKKVLRKEVREVRALKRATTESKSSPITFSKVSRLNDTNSAEYVRALYNPWNATGVRIPEIVSFPSTANRLKFSFGLTKIAGASTTDWIWGFNIRPQLYQCYNMIATSTSGLFGTLTWGSSSSVPQYSALNTNMCLYRTVAMGITVHNAGAILNQGGEVFYGMFPRTDTQTNDADIFNDLVASQAYGLETAMENGNFKMAWRPLTMQPIIEDTAAGYTTSPTSTMYASVDETRSDNSLLWGLGTSNTNTTNTITVEVVMDIESIPFLTVGSLHETKEVEGSPAAQATAETMVQMAARDSGVSDQLKTGAATLTPAHESSIGSTLMGLANKGVNSIAKVAESFIDTGGLTDMLFGTAAQTGFLSDLGGLAGGLLFAKSKELQHLHGKHDIRHTVHPHNYRSLCDNAFKLHQICNALGMPKLSPYSHCSQEAVDPRTDPIDLISLIMTKEPIREYPDDWSRSHEAQQFVEVSDPGATERKQ